MVELFQTMKSQYPVLFCHGNDIRRDAYRAEIQQGYKPGEGNAVVLGEGLHELKSHAAPA